MPSKLGLHIQRRRSGWPDTIADATPSVVKSLEWAIIDDWIAEEQGNAIKRARAAKWQGQNVFLLGRHAVPEQHLDKPLDRAFAFWNRLLDAKTRGRYARRPAVLERMRLFDAWEGYNEIGTGADAFKLGQFDAYLAKRFHDEGMRYAGGGFAMTQPTLDDWPLYCQGVIETAVTGDGDRPDFLHLHEYWYPNETWPELLTEHGLIDAAKMRAATQGCMLHWRQLYQLPETPRQMKLPVIISECGWDQGWPQQVGFRKSGRPDIDYFRWLVWYDQELRKPLDGIDYVVGATIYTYGHTYQWSSFEIDQQGGRGVLDMLRDYMSKENVDPHPLDWQAAWERADAENPETAESHYVLLSQDIHFAWRQALEKYLDAYKCTNGQSLTDALCLKARRHHITLVGRADVVGGVSSQVEAHLREQHPEILVDRMDARDPAALRALANRRAERGDRFGAREGSNEA